MGEIVLLIMSEVPVKTTSGDIGCPRCESPLRVGQAPFYLHGEYVGNCESLVCPICNYSALTSSGYLEATAKAKMQGLIGPEEIFEVPEIGEEDYWIAQQTTSKMRKRLLKQKERLNEKSFSDESDNDVRELTGIVSSITINTLTKKKLIL